MGTALFEAGVSDRILMSGDHSRENYDEVGTMKDYAVAAGVSPDCVFKDHAGLDTYSTMYRAKEIFQAQKVVIVTQKFHISRAVYLARALGLEAYGVACDQGEYTHKVRNELRETLARVKAVWSAIVQPEPEYLGDAIPIWEPGQRDRRRARRCGQRIRRDTGQYEIYRTENIRFHNGIGGRRRRTGQRGRELLLDPRPGRPRALLADRTVPADYVEESLRAQNGEPFLSVYLAQNAQGEEQKNAILAGIETLRGDFGDTLGSLRVETAEVCDDDWRDNWKQFYHPLEIGERFVVRPSWEPYAGCRALEIVIDPESSFGTGQHETTRLCLSALEMLDVAGKSVLDMGCGSGILGIGALKLGASHVTAVDIDSNAAAIAEKKFRAQRRPVRRGTRGQRSDRQRTSRTSSRPAL